MRVILSRLNPWFSNCGGAGGDAFMPFLGLYFGHRFLDPFKQRELFWSLFLLFLFLFLFLPLFLLNMVAVPICPLE